jgi:flagellin-like protein
MSQSRRRGVSSVIGIILLVAVTVIIAATTATFALSIKDKAQNSPPKGDFDFTYNNGSDTKSFKEKLYKPYVGSDNLTITYTGGDTISSARVNVTVNGAIARNQRGNAGAGTLEFDPRYGGGNLFSNTDQIRAGDSYTISDQDFYAKGGTQNLGILRKLDLSEATVRVYWISKSTDNSAVVAKWTGPEA